MPEGPITEAGLRTNVDVGLRYLESWLRGNGCVPIFNLMEDAATAEISRAQIWQWIRHPAGVLADGRKITVELFAQRSGRGAGQDPRETSAPKRYAQGKFALAGELFLTRSPRARRVRRVPDAAGVRAS